MSSQSIPQTIPRVTPAIIQKIREAIGHFSFTSGTCKVPSEFFKLYYCESPDSVQAKSLNTANATEGQLASLISVCEAASFGRGTETVLDESYRKALKLDLSQFSTPFDLASTPILRRIQQDLVDIDTTLRRHIRTEPYKLNIYDKGAFFKPHQDTPRAENMFGSLVIVFPTPHEGGELILTQGDQSWTFDAAQALSNSTPTEPELASSPFTATLLMKFSRSTSGARITLTFNLYFENSTSESALPVIPTVTDQFLTIKGAMTELLAEPRIVDGSIDTICFGLSHSPTPTQSSVIKNQVMMSESSRSF